MVLCALQPDWTPNTEARRLLLDRLTESGIETFEKCGNESRYFITGGFCRIHLVEHRRPTLVANHQGGYRVFCGSCKAMVTPAFVNAIKEYREGRAERALRCPRCQLKQDLDDLSFRPPAVFTCFEIQLHDVQNTELTPKGHRFFDDWFEGYRTVLRRVG